MKLHFQSTWSFGLLLLGVLVSAAEAAPPVVAKGQLLNKAEAPLIPSPAQIEEGLKSLDARKKSSDPFGLSMYPTEKSAVGKDDSASQQRPTNRVTLSQAVHSLKIGLVNPLGKEFVVHGNNIYQGDTITLAYKGESFAAQVTEVTAYRIVFTDLKDHNFAWVSLAMIPSLQAAADGPQRTLSKQKYLLPMEPFKQSR